MPTRRSGRIRRPNQAYQNAVDLSFLDNDSDSDSRPIPPPPVEEDEDDKDFEILATDIADANGDPDEYDGGSDPEVRTPPSSEDGNLSRDGDEDFSDVLDEDDMLLGQTGLNQKLMAKLQGKSKKYLLAKSSDANQQYSQAVELVSRHTNHDAFFHMLHGQDPVYVQRLLQAMEASRSDTTVPSRVARGDGRAGIAPSPFSESSPATQQAIHAWFQKHIESDRFMDGQVLKSLSFDEAANFLPAPNVVRFVSKPSSSASPHQMPSGDWSSLDNVWPQAAAQIDTEVDQHSGDANQNSVKVSRAGFLINVGDSIKDLSWLPVDDATTQYLAVATRPEHSVKPTEGEDAQAPKSAFVPNDPHPSCIQVWRFGAKETWIDGAFTVATTEEPMRLLALCGYFGYVKDVQWCPQPATSKKGGPMAFLATIHDDGYLRLFALDLPKTTTSKKTQYIQAESASFQSRPPFSIFTCMKWVSSHLLAAGTADGHVAIFDMQEYFDTPYRKSDGVPYFYHAFHESYVLAVESCAPSRPELLISTSMDGITRLTDVRDPLADTAECQRQRIPTSFGTWYERGQGILSSDELPSLRICPVRSISISTRIARLEAPLTSLATSPLHYSVLAGAADGTVFATNPTVSWWRFRTHMPWKQPWFKHDWRPGRCKSNDDSEVDYPNGLTRLSTGLRMQAMDDMSRIETSGKARRKGNDPLEAHVIHEKPTAIKSLAWNPNVPTGGWAAAGMGDGLLWVEDIARD